MSVEHEGTAARLSRRPGLSSETTYAHVAIILKEGRVYLQGILLQFSCEFKLIALMKKNKRIICAKGNTKKEIESYEDDKKGMM
jgi:fibrillarin-like rRNA methylase